MNKADVVTIKSGLSAAEAAARISSKTKAISGCLAYAMATTYGTESELVGEVSSAGIVVARARPLTHNSSKPVFTGTFIESGEGTLLQGVFSYNCFGKYVFWISTVILTTAEVFIIVSLFAPESKPLFSLKNVFAVTILPGLQLAAYLLSRIVTDPFFKSDKKWIEEELKRIVS